MKNRLILTETKITGTQVEYSYRAEGPWSGCFHGQTSYITEYAFDLSGIPKSVLTVSFLGNILPAAWVYDAEVQVPSCDEDFYACLGEVRQGFVNMYPMLSFGGQVTAGQLEKNRGRESDHKAAMLFSGGVDAFYTLLCHSEENPLLAAVWGSDIPLSEKEGFGYLKSRIEETADYFRTEATVIRSAFREAVTNRDFTPAVKKSGDQYWHGFQHGLALLTLMAPVAYRYGVGTVYIASSFKAGDHYTCASDPTIDNYVRYSGTKVHHDGYDASRQQKISRIISFTEETGIPVRPHVCFKTTDGKNCCRCEKCERTIIGFYGAGADPRRFGFEEAPSLEEMGQRLRSLPETQRGSLMNRYGPSQKALKERYQKEELPEEMWWFYDADLAGMDAGEMSAEKENTTEGSVDVKKAPEKGSSVEGKKAPEKGSSVEGKNNQNKSAKGQTRMEAAWETAAYQPLRRLAGKYRDYLEGKPDGGWKTEWKKFRYIRLASKDYENRHAPDFREKLVAARRDKEGKEGPRDSRMPLSRRQIWKERFSKLDFMLCWYFLGAEPEDYFSMTFAEKGWRWRNHHVTRMRLNFLKTRLNTDPDTIKLLNDKAEFCRLFSDLLDRRWCDMEDVTAEEFSALFQGTKRLMAKPRTGSGGKGILVFETGEPLRDIYEKIRSLPGSYIVEEYHEQTGWLHKANPSSLNTIRVTTIGFNGRTDVVFAYLRTGIKGAVVDNLHSGGIRFPIDHHTGRLYPGMSYQTSGIMEHPDTGMRLAGRVIPGWDKVMDYCRDAHSRVPESLHFIGWDICVDRDGICLIEGNASPGFPPITNPVDNWWKDMKVYMEMAEADV